VATTAKPRRIPGLLGFDGRVERQQVGLVGDLDDGHHHLIDVAGLLVEDRQFGVDQIGRPSPSAWSSMRARPCCPEPAATEA
jgi:hypothetical protein